jgi:thiamine biosynthesis lipoprotein
MTAATIPAEGARASHARLVSFTARAMGSPLRLMVVCGTHPAARRRAAAAWATVREEFEAAEQAMSRFRERSEITLLNRRVGPVERSVLSRRLLAALTTCERARRLTDGRFDPRVLRILVRLGVHGAPLGRIVAAESSDRSTCGRIVERDADGRIHLPEPVDLGGIGKGLALRWAAAAVGQAGCEGFLLDAGGDIVARGQPPGHGPWRIGIEDPTGATQPLAVVTATNEAVATSSIRRRQWRTADRMVHHLIDPVSGEPGGGGLLAVTVAGSDPAWSEVWSKALFVEGRAGIASLARERDLAAWWVTEGNSLEMTAAARLRTIWAAGEEN